MDNQSHNIFWNVDIFSVKLNESQSTFCSLIILVLNWEIFNVSDRKKGYLSYFPITKEANLLNVTVFSTHEDM